MRNDSSYYRGADLSFDPLTPDEEMAIYRRMMAGDLTARSELVRRHLRWAASMAKRFGGRLKLEDAIGAANEGLMEALVRWDARKGRFFQYAYSFIRGAIFAAVSHAPVVPTNTHVMTQRSRIRRAREQLLCPAETLGLRPERVAEIEAAWECEQAEMEVGDVADEDQLDIVSVDIVQALRAMENCLPTRDRHILKYRYGLLPMPDGANPSLTAIGKLFGLSGERIRQIVQQSLSTLRRTLCEEP